MTGPSTPLPSDREVAEFVASVPTVLSRPMALLDRDTPLVAQMLEHELTFCPEVGVVVARLDLVKQVRSDPVTISSRPAAPSMTSGRTPAVIGAPAGLPPETVFLLNVDGRDHARLREVFVAGFSPATVPDGRHRREVTTATTARHGLSTIRPADAVASPNQPRTPVHPKYRMWRTSWTPSR